MQKEIKQKKTIEDLLKPSIDLLHPYIKRLWKHKYKFVALNFIVAIITICYLLIFVPPYYISKINIMPDYGSKTSSLGGLSSLASLAGFNIGESTPAEVYDYLINNSETILEPIITANYETKKYLDSVNLFQYFKIDKDKSLPSNLQQRAKLLDALDLLKSKITTNIGQFTKILTITVKMPESKLSADVANKMVASLDNYIKTKRKSYAIEQRKYLEKRLNQVKDSLTYSENSLKDFKEQNRIIGQSPELSLKQSRLLRGIEILNTVYIELSKQLELAKIEEVKDTPVINTEEPAYDSVYKAGPSRRTAFILIMLFSLFISTSYYVFSPDIRSLYKFLRSEFS